MDDTMEVPEDGRATVYREAWDRHRAAVTDRLRRVAALLNGEVYGLAVLIVLPGAEGFDRLAPHANAPDGGPSPDGAAVFVEPIRALYDRIATAGGEEICEAIDEIDEANDDPSFDEVLVVVLAPPSVGTLEWKAIDVPGCAHCARMRAERERAGVSAIGGDA